VTTAETAPYFDNHERRNRFPWSLYHADLAKRIANVIADHSPEARVLLVGCGLEPYIEGAPHGTEFWGCDVDARAVECCARMEPELAPRLAVCPSAYELPEAPGFEGPFDVIVAKEVVEHLDEPVRWVRGLSERVALGGELVLTTPNYGRLSTLPLIEATVLELVARKDGYSRRHIHPSKFDRRRLSALQVGEGMKLVSVTTAWTGWTLMGRWSRTDATS